MLQWLHIGWNAAHPCTHGPSFGVYTKLAVYHYCKPVIDTEYASHVETERECTLTGGPYSPGRPDTSHTRRRQIR
jgi:hypothetical protein